VDTRNSPSRRQVVGAAAGAFSVCALAACGGGSDTASPSTSTSGAAAASSTPAASQGSADLAALSDVPVGGAIKVEGPAGPTILAQPTAGNVVAFSAKCTHKGVPLDVDGTELVCSAHGSVFEALTGKVVKGPATTPLPAVAGVKVEGTEIVAG
jgi:nitrite reductase/ring-hydroxylating ferredoxin subunit